MKKKNILDILIGEYIDDAKIKQANYKRCGIEDFEAFKKEYIASFLSDNQETYGYTFDLNSNDKKIASQSKAILDNMGFSFKNALREVPEYYLEYVKNKGIDLACYNLCFRLLLFSDIKELIKEHENFDYVEFLSNYNDD